MIKPHLFENRNYDKIKRWRIFFVLSAVAEILGDSWLATGKKPQCFQEVAVNMESITIKMLATKKESMLPVYFISRRCAEAWCLIILLFSNHL